MFEKESKVSLEYINDRFEYLPNGTLIYKDWFGPATRKGEEAGKLKDGYIHIGFLGEGYKRSRIVWFMHTGKWPENYIDHINGIRHDDRFENLRDVTNHQNRKNTKKLSTNKSGYTNIWIYEKNGKKKFKVRIRAGHGNERINLGIFDSIDEAIANLESAKEFLGYHRNHGK